MNEAAIFDLLAAGGDMATMALVFVLWKFDRRILRIETFLFMKQEKTPC